MLFHGMVGFVVTNQKLLNKVRKFRF